MDTESIGYLISVEELKKLKKFQRLRVTVLDLYTKFGLPLIVNIDTIKEALLHPFKYLVIHDKTQTYDTTQINTLIHEFCQQEHLKAVYNYKKNGHVESVEFISWFYN
jgi:hypothetical protein